MKTGHFLHKMLFIGVCAIVATAIVFSAYAMNRNDTSHGRLREVFLYYSCVGTFWDFVYRKVSQIMQNIDTQFATANDTAADREHVIVVFNPVDWFSPYLFNPVLSSKCAFKNCRLTSSRTNLQIQSAVIFMLTAAPALPWTPPLSPSGRNPDQVWIFSWLESPVHHFGSRCIYKNKYWRNAVNWTMSYTSDADILLPYGRVNKRTAPTTKNYSAIFERKSKMAAWVVSNCKTQSRREIYIEGLRRHGVAVDMYGGCAGSRVHSDEIKRNIDQNYMFYLSFENSFCKDYITEKFFEYGKLDVVLVVRGGGNYSNHMPDNSFINTADFWSVGDLAKYLTKVAAEERLYTRYLRNKDQFEFDSQNANDDSFCKICEKLNDLDRNRKTYTDFVERIHKGTCYKPQDLVT